MTSTNNNTKELAAAKTIICYVGDTMYMFIGTQDEGERFVRSLERKLKPDGDAIRFQDGRRIFIEVAPVTNAGMTGSRVYVWNKSGEKVKADVLRVEFAPGGSVTRTKIRTTYVTP